MFANVNEVSQWLREQTGERLFHVKLLKAAYRDENRQRMIEIYTELAKRLQSQPELTLALLNGESGGWRSSVIGNAVVILQRHSASEDVLAQCIIKGNWAAPQLAAGFALITQGNAVPQLETFLTSVDEQHSSLLVYPKGYLSAYAALKLIGNQTAEQFEATSAFEQLKGLDRDECIGWANFYWSYWKDVPPITEKG